MKRKCILFISTLFIFFFGCSLCCQAAPPVRIAIVPGNGSGMEQSIIDGLSTILDGNPNVVISTVNPDWYVICNLIEQTDQVGGTVKVNGTVTIKTIDGQILNNIAAQTNKSDFSLQPGAPLNKALVQSAVQELISGITQRAQQPLEDAINIEIATREKVISAQSQATKDNWDQALATLAEVSPDSPHFKAVRVLMSQYEMEKQSMELFNNASTLAKSHQYSKAIGLLSEINPKSKRYKLAKLNIANYRSALSHFSSLAKLKGPQSTSTNNTQLKALATQKKALEIQQKAIEAQEAALKFPTK